jgi:hypothetical protein
MAALADRPLIELIGLTKIDYVEREPEMITSADLAAGSVG